MEITSSRQRALTGACIGFALIQLDVTIVNVALVHIESAFAAPLAGLQWVVDTYTLAFAGLMLPAGGFADRWGGQRAFALGLTLFALASIVCAAAISLTGLVAARALQGVGAALLMPASLALVRVAYPESGERARAIGVWGAAGGAATAAGPLIGGALIALLSWRSIFWINVPVCLAALYLVLPIRPESGRPYAKNIPDLVSALLITVAIGTLIAIVIFGPRWGWLNPHLLLLTALAITAAILFVFSERRSPRPLIPVALHRNGIFRVVIGAGFGVSFCFYGLIFVLSLYWQDIRGYSPLITGLAFLPVTGQVLLTSLLTGRWIARSGTRAPMLWGFVLAACGYAGFCLVGDNTALAWLVPISLAVGTGTVLAVTGLTTTLLSCTSGALAGTAAGAFSAARQAGAALGVAVLGTFVSTPGRFVEGLHWSAGVATFVSLICAAAVLPYISR